MKRVNQKAGGLATLFVIVALAASLNPSGASSTGPRPATADEVDEFAVLVERARHAIVPADMTGDASAFPEVFYNDAEATFHHEYYDVLARVSADEISATLAIAAPGPHGDATGLLTAYTAIVIDNERTRAAWAEVEARAADEGRAPTTADMPNNDVPRPRLDGWHDYPIYLFAVVIDGDHVIAWEAYEDLQGQSPDYMPDPATRYEFTRVDGRWYVSNLEMVPGPNVQIGEWP